jgi:hypothetical protein
MNLLAIDPGPVESCYCVVEAAPFRLVRARLVGNEELLDHLRDRQWCGNFADAAIEGIESYGMAVGREVFDTAINIGRFLEAARSGMLHPRLVYRSVVKLTVCHTRTAKDGNIRSRLMDVFGGKGAKGTIKRPGPLFGLAGHGWAAFALAITFWETRGHGRIEQLAAQYARTDEQGTRDEDRAHHQVPAVPTD